MADGGYTGEYAPNSELNPEGPAVSYTFADGGVVAVQKNDWLDVDESLPNDPLWGYSRQVYECLPNAMVVKEYDPGTDSYVLTSLDPSLCSNCFARLPKTFDGLPENQPTTTAEKINNLESQILALETRVDALEN